MHEVKDYPLWQKKTIDEMRKDGTLKKLSEKWFSIDVTQEAKK